MKTEESLEGIFTMLKYIFWAICIFIGAFIGSVLGGGFK